MHQDLKTQPPDSSGIVKDFVDLAETSVAEPYEANPSASTKSADIRDAELDEYLSRWRPVGTHTWSTANVTGINLLSHDFPRELLDDPNVVRKTANYKLARYDSITIRAMIDLPSTFSGHVILYAFPTNYSSNVDYFVQDQANFFSRFAAPSMYRCRQNVHAHIVPAVSQSVEFELPWVAPYSAIDLGKVSGATYFSTQWTVVATVIAPLRSAMDTATVRSVPLRLYAKFNGFRLSMPFTYEMFSGPAKAISDFVGSKGAGPKLTDFTTPVSKFAQGFSDLASIFGFTREPKTQASLMVPRTLANIANSDADDTSAPLTLFKSSHVHVGPAAGGSSADPLSFEQMLNRPTLLRLATWSQATAAGTTLMTIPVSPIACWESSTDLLETSPMSLAAGFAGFWRGTIRYELRIHASSLHRGRLQVVYNPLDVGFSGTDPTADNYSFFYDVASNDALPFCVGWAQPSYWATSNRPFNLDTLLIANSRTINGSFSILVANPLVAPDALSDLTVEIWAWAEPGDLQFAAPMNHFEGTFESERGQAGETELKELACVDLVRPDPADADAPMMSMGESIVSFRTLCTRPSYLHDVQFPFTPSSQSIGTTFKEAWVRTSHLPVLYPLTAGSEFVPLDCNNAPTSSVYLYNHPLLVLSSCFMGHRGSLHFKLVCSRGGANYKILRAYASLNTGQSEYASADFATATDRVKVGFGAAAKAPLGNITHVIEPDVSSALEVRVPFVSPWRYLTTTKVPRIANVAQAPSGLDTTWLDFNFEVAPGSQSQTDWPTTLHLGELFMHAGADFSFEHFRFTPLYNHAGSRRPTLPANPS